MRSIILEVDVDRLLNFGDFLKLGDFSKIWVILKFFGNVLEFWCFLIWVIFLNLGYFLGGRGGGFASWADKQDGSNRLW